MLTSGFTSEKESAHELYFAMILFLVRIYVHLLFISCVDHKLPERPLFPCGGVGGVLVPVSDHIHAKNNGRFSFFFTKWLLVI